MKITIVGCGGTGSYLVPNVLRLFKEKNKEKNIDLEFTLIDYDIVAENNIPRQNFCFSDVGKNKAYVLGERYSGVFGIPITAMPIELTENNYRNDDIIFATLCILCVDNNKTRRIFWEDQGRRCQILDVGNELDYGQVFYGDREHKILIQGIHPEIRKDIHQSCAETPEQSFLINYVAANATTIFVNHLIETNWQPKYFEILFDIYGNFTKRFVKDYDKFKNQIIQKIVDEKMEGKQNE